MDREKISSFGEFGDYPRLIITGKSKERLIAAMNFLENNKASGYYLDKNKLVYFWTDHDLSTKFPVLMSLEACSHIAFEWLKETADYGKEPDHDGSNSKGWKISIDAWGHIEGFGWQAFVRIEPYWIMCGK